MSNSGLNLRNRVFKSTVVIQIVAVNDDTAGDALEGSFRLIEENLDLVISKIPQNLKVSVVSVVGTFSPGKSCLLNFFLRYLRYGSTDHMTEEDWMTAEGEQLALINLSEGHNKLLGATYTMFWAVPSKATFAPFPKGLAWRCGQEKPTTGMWLWSEPFVRSTASGEKVAVLLMDTQGMFDSDTSTALSSRVFGLSTFVSSYQVRALTHTWSPHR